MTLIIAINSLFDNEALPPPSSALPRPFHQAAGKFKEFEGNLVLMNIESYRFERIDRVGRREKDFRNTRNGPIVHADRR